MPRRKPHPDAIDVATKPSKQAFAFSDLTDVLIPRTCKLCGAETGNKTSLCAKCHKKVITPKEERELVQDTLRRNAHRYAELQMAGAEIAAARGDTRPSEWGLLHTRTIEPIKTKDEGGGGVIVQIGMVLPGLPPGTAPQVTVRALPGSPAPVDAEVIE